MSPGSASSVMTDEVENIIDRLRQRVDDQRTVLKNFSGNKAQLKIEERTLKQLSLSLDRMQSYREALRYERKPGRPAH